MKMVSRITAIGLAGVAICYLGLSGYVWYHDNKRSKQADVQASAVSENNKVLGFLREKGCDYCHTPSAELPAYYYIPGAKQLMDYDIKLGYKSFNLEAVRAALLANKPVSQSDLNKIEWVMQYETMPPTRYTALHWAGKVSDEERAEILAWIAKQRAEYYAKKDARFADYLTEGRAFGPHGADLVIANSIAHYDDTLSRELTDLTVKANLAIRELGFKPYLAPAFSSGAISLLLTLQGAWHYSSVYFGKGADGAFLGLRNRLSAEQVEYEDLLLPPALYARIEHAYHNLCALI